MGHLKTSFWEGAIMENENKIGEQNTSILTDILVSMLKHFWPLKLREETGVMQCERPLWSFGLYCVPTNNGRL